MCLKLTSKRIKEVSSNLIVDKLTTYRWNLVSPSRSLNQAARARGCALSYFAQDTIYHIGDINMEAKPYVYKVTHNTTGHFYIGMRSANKLPATQDLGFIYFTSSKKVKAEFFNYTKEIIQEFESWDQAFLFENKLIEESWGSPLLLNRHYQKNIQRFSMRGMKRPDLADYNKSSKKKPKEERSYQCNMCSVTFSRVEFCHKPKKTRAFCPLCVTKIKATKKPKKMDKSNKIAWNKGIPSKYKGVKRGKTGKPSWNKGIPNPNAADNGKKGAEMQSKTVQGRKIAIREDGTRYWIYPLISDVVVDLSGSAPES